MTRRHAFTIAAQGLGGLAGAAIILPAVGFAVAPIFHRGKERWEAVGPTRRLRRGHLPPGRLHRDRGDRRRRQDHRLRAPRLDRVRRGPERLHRRLQPLRPPRLPGALRRGRRQLHLPLPRRRLRLPGQADRRPAGPPARPVPGPHPAAARSNSARASASPPSSSRSAPATPASSPAASGNTSTRRAPPPSRRHEQTRQTRQTGPGAAAQTGEAGRQRPEGRRARRTSRTRRPSGRATRARLVDQAKEAPIDALAWVDQRTAATGFLTGMLFRKVPKGTNWFYTLGSATLFAFIVAGGHRRLPGDVLHALDDPGLRFDRPHQQRRLPRRLRARHAQVGLERDGHPDLPPHGPHLLLRRLQVPARAQLGDRGRAPDPDHDDGLHRLPAALRPALLLGLGRRHQHQRHRPDRRPLPERLPARRPGAGGDDALALLRDPHAAPARARSSP